MSYFKIKSYAKINLALNIVGKSKLLHRIESLISFVDLHDEIKIKKIDSKKHKIRFTGKFSDGIKSKNTISELLKNIDKRGLLRNHYQILIKKNVPSQAGLGGGSMNASSILKFLIKKDLKKMKKKDILEISNSIGSDVKLGLYSKNLVLKANNQITSLSLKKKFNVLIIKPNFGCSTKTIYKKVKKFNKPKFNSISKKTLSIGFLKKMKNDLETIVVNERPKMKVIKNFLVNLSDIDFVRMTGSGSAIIAYFSSVRKCKEAEKKVKKQFRNYWCKIAKTI